MGLGDMISGAGDAISSGVSKLKDWLGGDEEAGAEKDPWAGLGRPFVEKKDIIKLDTEDSELGTRTVPEPRSGHGIREEGTDEQGNELWHREEQHMTSNWRNFGPRKMGEARDLPHLDTTSEESDAVRTVPEDRPSHRTRPEGLVDENGNLAWRRSEEKSTPPGSDREKKSSRGRKSLGDKAEIVDFVSFGGVRYQFKYLRPTAAEVDAQIGDSYDPAEIGNDTHYKKLFSIEYNKLLKERREAALGRAKVILTSFSKKLERLKAESGISRRLNAEEIPIIRNAEGNADEFLKEADTSGSTPEGGWKSAGGSAIDAKKHNSSSNKVVMTLPNHTESFLTLADDIDSLLWYRRRHKGNESKKIIMNSDNEPFYPEKIDVGIFPVENKTDSNRKNMITSTKVTSELPHQLAMRFGGFGDTDFEQYQFFHNLNIFNKSFTPGAARELRGFTFITRPHLNLTNRNLAHISRLTHLLQADNTSVSMYIRQMLDTTYAEKYGGVGGTRFCPLLDSRNPFNVLLCNALVSINGFPDPDLTTESTSGGFFSEQQTNVIGYNRLAKGQDLQLEFKDYEGGIVLAMHDVWCQYAGYIADGQMMQYLDDIEDNIMGYTVSIYRFVTDHTGRFITRWAKATGCYPKLYPTGTPFNVNEGEQVLSAVKRFTIPYWAHHFDYNNPEILMDFRKLVKRYCRSIDVKGAMVPVRPSLINNNLMGIPYIEERSGRFELVFKVDEGEDPIYSGMINDPPENKLEFQKFGTTD